MFRPFLIAAAASCLLTPSSEAASAENVLARMDQSAAAFKSLSAGVRKTSYTKVIDDKGEETGTMMLRRQGPKGLETLIEFTQPDPRTVAFSGMKAEIYYPKMKTVQEYNLSKYSALVDQFLLVGFGTSGKELSSNYHIKAVGEESIAGVPATHLELTPKTEARREKLKTLDLWITEEGYPVQQKFLQPSGDYTSFTYTNVKLNAPLSEDALKLKVPKGVKREFPQK